MTMPSRGISPIQEKARGNDMKAKNVSMKKTKVSVKKPMGDMGMGSEMPMGMKKGGSCKGYYKGGSVDGIVKKGRTKGKIC
jgi:hypothetical protein